MIRSILSRPACCGPRSRQHPSDKIVCLASSLCLSVVLVGPFTAKPSAAGEASAPEAISHKRSEHGSLSNIGAKLADPTSNVWALQLNISGPQFFDGDLNSGSPELGGNAVFQPVLPIPLYGTGENQWKMVTRPIVPIVFSAPVPRSGAVDDFNAVGGLGDIEIPLVFTPPRRMLGNWIFGAGPVFEFPSATSDELGENQYSVGPALALGYKTKKWTALVFPNYFFGVGSSGDRTASQATTSKLALLYAFVYNLPDAWQVGFNPTITYNDNASPGNQWTVPVGLFVAKTTAIGGHPVKMQFGLDYSVVSPNTFGQRAAFRFVITPVIPGLISKPIFGGK